MTMHNVGVVCVWNYAGLGLHDWKFEVCKTVEDVGLGLPLVLHVCGSCWACMTLDDGSVWQLVLHNWEWYWCFMIEEVTTARLWQMVGLHDCKGFWGWMTEDEIGFAWTVKEVEAKWHWVMLMIFICVRCRYCVEYIVATWLYKILSLHKHN